MTHTAPILLTRPEAASYAFADALRDAAGHELRIVISPLMSIAFMDLPKTAAEADTVIFTSRNGVESWARSGMKTARRAICVGPATTKAARDLGFNARQGGEDVEALFESIKAMPPEGRILHVHGAHTRGQLVQRLTEQGLNASGVIGYDQPLLALTEEAKTLLCGKEPVIVPLFSPRTAAQFAQECPKGAKAVPIAISPAVAEIAQTALIAERPDGASMIMAVLSRL